MSSPKQNATPAEMAALAKLNQRLYGTKPEIGPGKSMSGGNVGTAIASTATTPMPPKRPPPLPPMEPKRPPPLPPTPRRPDPLPPREPVGTQMPALRPTGKPSNRMEYKKGGSVPSASKRADGIAQRGKTRGKMC